MNYTLSSVAAALKSTRPLEHWAPPRRLQWNMDVIAISKAFSGRAIIHDEDLFFAACGGLHEFFLDNWTK